MGIGGNVSVKGDRQVLSGGKYPRQSGGSINGGNIKAGDMGDRKRKFQETTRESQRTAVDKRIRVPNRLKKIAGLTKNYNIEALWRSRKVHVKECDKCGCSGRICRIKELGELEGTIARERHLCFDCLKSTHSKDVESFQDHSELLVKFIEIMWYLTSEEVYDKYKMMLNCKIKSMGKVLLSSQSFDNPRLVLNFAESMAHYAFYYIMECDRG